jgi:hypothetical protein
MKIGFCYGGGVLGVTNHVIKGSIAYTWTDCKQFYLKGNGVG